MPLKVVKRCVTGNGLTAVAYWGGTLQVFDAAGTLKAQQALSQDIAQIAWAKKELIVGLADGRVLGLRLLVKP